MKRLRIAVPTFDEEITNYENALRELGAEAIIVREICDPTEYDGLLIPGGGDVDPARFGQKMDGSLDVDPALDELQLETMDCFVKAGKAVFGICRGHQVINIYFGGDLIQDLGEERNLRHRRTDDFDKVHKTITEAGTWLAKLYGTEYFTNSAHHQGLGRIGTGLTVVSKAEDGVVEALAHETLPIYSLQWHPERMCFSKKRTDTVDGSLALRFFLDLCEKTSNRK